MTPTLCKSTLRELLADTLRDHRGDAPGGQADALLETLKKFAPKSYTEERIDLDPADDRLEQVAREMILSHAFDVAQYEIHAAYPRLTDAEVQAVDDLIGLARIEVSFN